MSDEIYIARVGDRVRSFDFPDHSLEGERACYVEGVVVARYKAGDQLPFEPDGSYILHRPVTECDRVAIEVDRHIVAGQDRSELLGVRVYPPQNGVQHWLGGYTNGIQKIEQEA